MFTTLVHGRVYGLLVVSTTMGENFITVLDCVATFSMQEIGGRCHYETPGVSYIYLQLKQQHTGELSVCLKSGVQALGR